MITWFIYYMLYELNLGLQLLWFVKTTFPARLHNTVSPKPSIVNRRKGKKDISLNLYPNTPPIICMHIPRYVYKQEIYMHMLLYLYVQKSLNRLCCTTECRNMEKVSVQIQKKYHSTDTCRSEERACLASIVFLNSIRMLLNYYIS